MSEMVDEIEDALANEINAALVGFTGCMGEAVDDICTYGITIGEVYVPFDPDPEDKCKPTDAQCSQLWVRVTDINIAYAEKGMDATPGSEGPCAGTCGGTFSIGLEVGVLRCIEVRKNGQAPYATQVLAASMQSIEDSSAIYQAAMNCEVWASIEVGSWSPIGPLGGQYGGAWTFTVEL